MNKTIDQYKNIKDHTELPEDVVHGIERCVTSAFGGTITREDALQHMAGDQLLVVTSDFDGTIEGFSASKITSARDEFGDDELDPTTGLYLSAAAIAVDSREQGIYQLFNTTRINFGLEHGMRKIFTRTQNRKVELGVTKTIEEKIRDGEISDYQLSRIVKKGVYGRMLTAEKPTTGGPVFDGLDYEKGDAVLLTWDITV